MVLDKLSEFGSVRQVLMWLREENVSLPTPESERPRAITWRLPTYRIVLRIERTVDAIANAGRWTSSWID
jgi:hypothetical protein